MPDQNVITLDLNFLGVPGAIACYVIPHNNGIVLIECGPGSTLLALQTGLQQYGYTVQDITDVFLTHIHLDHAGSAGWLAQEGARIHVHPVGAPHMLNPEKLLASAARIYGAQMETLWGEFLPIPEEKMFTLEDEEVVEVNGLRLQAIDTPGHADHHLAYLYEDLCFSGDIGGVRLADTRHLRLPMPPPEFHPIKWQTSLKRLQKLNITRIAPTHYGIFSDAGWHLKQLSYLLEETQVWIKATMASDPPVEEINAKLSVWSSHRAAEDGVPEDQIQAYEYANPTWMSGYGIQRYWRKFYNAEQVK
jgi:glyoxylase-like metal-dependent hydrolase (beta-lactamase superfamily II)